MSIPLTPIITQTVPTTGPAIEAGTTVAAITQPPGDEAEDVLYTKQSDPGNAYTLAGSDLKAAITLDGAFFVGVMAENGDGNSSEGSATLIFADDENVANDTDDSHAGNPQVPPPLPSDATAWPKSAFLRKATNMIIPYARDGVDFLVARPAKDQEHASVYWDDTTLGVRPDAEIDAMAQHLADEQPFLKP